jgi:cytochrome b pre-mRNA-processing protein 3
MSLVGRTIGGVMLKWWFGRDAGHAQRLYASASDWARQPHLYADLRVADTVDGRMAMLLLHLTILIERLGRAGLKGQELSLIVTEAFVEHMDDTFRHIGVGDLAVPRKVKKAAAALYDAHMEYSPALAGGEDAASAWRHALHLHLVSRGAAPTADIAALADHAMAVVARLKAIPDAAILAGNTT